MLDRVVIRRRGPGFDVRAEGLLWSVRRARRRVFCLITLEHHLVFGVMLALRKSTLYFGAVWL